MLKKFKKIIAVFILAIITTNLIIYAEGEFPGGNIIAEQDNDSFISLSSTLVATNTEFYVVLNLSKIDFSKFKVEISNNLGLSASEVTTAVAGLSTGTPTTFTVDKTQIGLSKIGIVYTSPKQESLIKFTAKITDLETTVESLQTKATNLETEIQTLQTNLTNLQGELSVLIDGTQEYTDKQAEIDSVNTQISTKQTEHTDLQNRIANFEPEVLEKSVQVNVSESSMDEMDKKEMNENMAKMKLEMSEMENNLQMANDKITSLTQTVTYQGSQNNYLSSLSITGVEFTSEFKKTTLNYFATVSSDVSKVTVKATAEDSSAIVTIYGNTNLEEGKNKIIVTVTADDGSVKNYVIYLTKEAKE